MTGAAVRRPARTRAADRRGTVFRDTPRDCDIPRERDTHRDRGVASLEYLGMLPLLLLIALAGIQLGIVAYCGEQAGTAARTAARTAAETSPHPDAGQAGRDAVSGWVNPEIGFPATGDGGAVKATATVQVPSVLPGLHLFGPVTRSATMPKEDTTP